MAYVKCDRIITSVGWKQGLTQSRSFLVTWCSLSIVESSLSWAIKGQVWMNGWGNICVAVLCRNWRLFRHIFIASFKVPYRWTSAFLFSLSSEVSAPRSQVLFHCEVACLSLAVWAACLARPLSLRFLFLCSEVSAALELWAVSDLQRLLVPARAWELF